MRKHKYFFSFFLYLSITFSFPFGFTFVFSRLCLETPSLFVLPPWAESSNFHLLRSLLSFHLFVHYYYPLISASWILFFFWTLFLFYFIFPPFSLFLFCLRHTLCASFCSLFCFSFALRFVSLPLSIIILLLIIANLKFLYIVKYELHPFSPTSVFTLPSRLWKQQQQRQQRVKPSNQSVYFRGCSAEAEDYFSPQARRRKWFS